MMASVNIPVELRYKLWKDAIQTATDLDGLILCTIEGSTKTRYEHAYGSNPGHGERQEPSRPRVQVPLSFTTKEQSVFLFGMPRTMRETATGCGAR
jgi:hypothetical protein